MLAGRLFCFSPSKRSSQPTLSEPFVHVLRSLISSHSFFVLDAGVVLSYSRTELTNPHSLSTSPPRLGAVKLPPTAVMVDKIMLLFLLLDFLFVASGGLLIATVFINKASMATQPTTTNVAANMVLMQTPLTSSRPLMWKFVSANQATGVIVNAVLIFVAFLISLPGAALSTNRLWLKLTGWMIAATAHVTLVRGVTIWFSTLQTRANLGTTFEQQSLLSQSLIQQKFQCCGYLNSPFTPDSVCTSAFVAAQKVNCVGPFSNFANSLLHRIFTALFGLVGLDVALLLAVVVVLKNRAEKARYRHIDEKNGINGGF